MNIQIFYSWQSDIEFNNKVIRDALKLSSIEIENKVASAKIDTKDSSSNLIGSTRIPEQILKDIAGSDIFVCDLTIIGKSDIKQRKISNPNVLIELGYAISKLSWERTIVLFNEHFGNFPADLPFDIEKRSALSFKITGIEDSNGKGILKNKLIEWIKKIIEINPSKPGDSISFKSEKRAKDVLNLRAAFSFIHFPGVDYFIHHGHQHILDTHVQQHVSFEFFTDGSEFYIYDSQARDLISRLRTKWNDSFNLFHLYEETLGNRHIFRARNVSQELYEADCVRHLGIKKSIQEFRRIWLDTLSYLRENYPEINFESLFLAT